MSFDRSYDSAEFSSLIQLTEMYKKLFFLPRKAPPVDQSLSKDKHLVYLGGKLNYQETHFFLSISFLKFCIPETY